MFCESILLLCLAAGVFARYKKSLRLYQYLKQEMTQTLATIDQYHYYLSSLK